MICAAALRAKVDGGGHFGNGAVGSNLSLLQSADHDQGTVAVLTEKSIARQPVPESNYG